MGGCEGLFSGKVFWFLLVRAALTFVATLVNITFLSFLRFRACPL